MPPKEELPQTHNHLKLKKLPSDYKQNGEPNEQSPKSMEQSGSSNNEKLALSASLNHPQGATFVRRSLITPKNRKRR